MSKETVDPDILKAITKYIAKTCPAVISGDAKTVETELAKRETEEILALFASDPQLSALIVQKRLKRHLKPDEDASLVKDNEEYAFELKMKAMNSNGGSTMAYIKATTTFNATQPMANQLHICQIDETNPLGAILGYIRHCFLPFSRHMMAQALEGESKDNNLGLLKSVNGKMGELEVELLRSQEALEIPKIVLDINTTIATFVSGQKKAGKAASVADLPNSGDATFLNEIQHGLNAWRKQILSVTRNTRDVDSGTTLQEINFWVSMEEAVTSIYEQKTSHEIEFTFKVLNENKRFLATTGFMADVGLAEEKDKDNVYKYYQLLRDLPIKVLLSATDIPKIMEGIEAVFNHLKKLKAIEYPLERAIQLVHAISRDVVSTLQSVLNSARPMAMTFEQFEKVTSCDVLFTVWDSSLETFNDELRDLKKVRPNEDILKIGLPYTELLALRARLEEVRSLRRAHEELHSVIKSTLSSDPAMQTSSLKAIAEALIHLRDVDVLATSVDGTNLYEDAVRSYKSKIDRVESDLEQKIRQLLDDAKDATEMFRVCARFNALFVRPRIQSAIREYQEQLIDTVKKDVQRLQEKFKNSYAKSEDKLLSHVRDLPPVSGAIIWAKQMERQLDMYMTRVEDVLGRTWHHHVEGRQLQRESEQFRQHLNVDAIFEAWLEETKHLEFDSQGKIFQIKTVGNNIVLGVNFDPTFVTLFKEVRNLQRLGLKVPFELKIAATDAKEKYPSAMRLQEVIRTYMRTCQRLQATGELASLAAANQKSIQDHISSGIEHQWDTEDLRKYVDTLGTTAVEFQDQAEELLRNAGIVSDLIKKLRTCDPTTAALGALITEIQKVVDHLDKRGFSNLKVWVDVLDNRIKDILVARLKNMLVYWTKAQDIEILSADDELDLDKAIEEERQRKEKDAKDDIKFDNEERKNAGERAEALKFVVKIPARHRITIRNQVLEVDPPLEHARLHLCKDLHTHFASICELPRLKCFWTAEGKKNDETFRDAMEEVNTEDLRACFDKISSKMSQASDYVNTWLQYQALWDMRVDAICDVLGNDLGKWERLLVDMKNSRATFDNSSTVKRFGPIVIDYASVQQKVNNKYDQWAKNILGRLGEVLSKMISKLFSEISGGRKTLETFHFEYSTTKEIIDSVTLLQSLNKKAEVWREQKEADKSAEETLSTNRFMFPSDWIYMDRVEEEWNKFEQILGRKAERMNKDSDKIKSKIGAEANKIEKKVGEFCAEWKEKRPTDANQDYNVAMSTLSHYDGRLIDLQDAADKIKLAREAMGMPAIEETRLIPVKEELHNLQEVWGILGGSWKELDHIGSSNFSTTKPTEVKKRLNKLLSEVQRLPTEVRQYSGYDSLRTKIKDVSSVNHLLVELNSGLLRPKHQRQVLQVLKIDVPWNNATLGDFWNADLKRHQKQLRYILEQAQGEGALEEYLRQVATDWEETKLELVDYRGKSWLIKNWDPIFELIGNALSDLGSMKHSPFYEAFETEARKWESRLNHAQNIFDVMVDVQRRWVYLEGIFNGSKEVQAQLSTVYRKFQGFDTEFVRQLKEMKRETSANYWCKEERGLLPRVEDWASLLDAIQKALAEYLEKQRQKFPRFYFVGDEDLLEIIGNAKDITKIMRHLPKMFAGIATLGLDDSQNVIMSMNSAEGEVVPLKDPIDVSKYESIHAWLNQLEDQMRETLANLLEKSLGGLKAWQNTGDFNEKEFFKWVDHYPAQIALLATQVSWCEAVDECLADSKPLQQTLDKVLTTLNSLADHILSPSLSNALRKKYEQLITELVQQRNVTRMLIDKKVVSDQDFAWLGLVRFYFNRTPKSSFKSIAGAASTKSKLTIQVSRAQFAYGFEYLGVAEKLVQTPLTDRCYLTLAESLHMKLGGNPYGPAGTGKTETVKALGATLGRFVLVFNCDENFDFQAMGRIFIGLCQCGAWGCFDEFNRLEERILSAVSQQILTIQTGLQQGSTEIKLLGRQSKLNDNIGMFITMNPGYAGRSNLPDNLKQLFRGIAMIKPNAALIAQVMLYSQGFRCAEEIAGRVVMLFGLCSDQLSNQSHYDFGLRALKSVLRSSGNLKRKIIGIREQKSDDDANDPINGLDVSSTDGEQAILVKSICGTIVPKLVSADVALFVTLMTAVFPDAKLVAPSDEALLAEINTIAKERHLLPGQDWIDKIMQLYEILSIHHGVIVVGPAGAGKSTVWTTLRQGLEKVQGRKIQQYVLDPKAMDKDGLYGALDSTTQEWTDGIFTSILRKIIDNVRGESQRDHWIVFDGDVDPEWAENLNSVLDDNQLFTLPNGERLALPPNVRIMFEVQNLDFATLATVSRCGMVWCSNRVIPNDLFLHNQWLELRNGPIHKLSASVYQRGKNAQLQCTDVIKSFFIAGDEDNTNLLIDSLNYAKTLDHVMEFTRYRAMMTTSTMIKDGIAKVIEYNEQHYDFPLPEDKVKSFMEKQILYAILWGMAGDTSLKERINFGAQLKKFTNKVDFPSGSDPLIDWEVRVDTANWHLWADKVPTIELDSHKVIKPDEVIQTVDTTRHVDVIASWLGALRPLILCGPPGSGKSMTLTSVLNAMPDFELVTLNFSSSTGCDLILRTLKHYCSCEKTPNGMVMRPLSRNKTLVIFCDEINLPEADAYDTQNVVTFLRQITEHGGFWRPSDLTWVAVEKVQILGACNPPADAGRVRLTDRFLRHCPLMFVDFPSIVSLKQIYGTFNRALLKLQPSLKSQWEPLTDAMIEVYASSQQRFTPDVQPHYIYSPRELSRWVRAMYEAMNPQGGQPMSLSFDQLVRLWVHEALRLFQDRLVDVPERVWTDIKVNETAKKYFRGVNDMEQVLERPVLFSNWLTSDYVSVEQEALRDYIKLRLNTFREEELDIKLVIFDEVLEHILRIDRVLRQPLGHLLLVGVSGGGKTVLSKFVSWMNGMSVFQIKVHKFYKAIDFDNDLRSVLIRAGCGAEKICFIFDESNVLDSAFLERMNALLASGEVPGLFEGPDWDVLMEQCKIACNRDGIILNKEEDLYRNFCSQVQRNLHVVFTMNPANEDFDNRSATSPALFNRCVIDWFGEWSSTALYQVGHEFTLKMQLSDAPPGSGGSEAKQGYESDEDGEKPKMVIGSGTERDIIVSSLVYIHESILQAMLMLARNTNRRTYVTPRHYLDFIKQYASMSNEKRTELEEQQRHLLGGLKRLKTTQNEVAVLKLGLNKKELELKAKTEEANSKLDQMMVDKAEAEAKRDASEHIAKEIKVQQVQIDERRVRVDKDLAQAKPALEEAANSVRNINKTDLDQVSRFPNPPAPVKLTLEPVVLLLGGKIDDWAGIRKILRSAERPFITSILEYDVNDLSDKLRKKVETKYLSDPNFTYDIVNNASRACGPLVNWLKSIINYARIKNGVQPLIDEVTELEEKSNALVSKQNDLTRIRDELSKRIALFKSEYGKLVGEAESIKNEMENVKSKVERSESLLVNLGTEQERWSFEAEGFQQQISTITGDCLLSAAFVAYVGYFNQAYRSLLVEKWTERLNSQGVKTKPDLSIINYMSHPTERLQWQSNELPDDDLCRENAIMMKKFNRYPLVIDPSGQATVFLMKQYKERKIIRTSFLDSGFIKHLEAALRFGNALLVEDVENLDPILNSVLNKEIFRQGGRIMITLGAKELDFSPSFVIFLSTRDPSCHFTPDLCSRVTFVNFTVTHSSLTTQCLGKVLKAERPDVDQKRSDLLKLQGEFRVKLRELEDSLLTALANAQGNILENDSVINTLETLKRQSSEVMMKMTESEKTLEEIEITSNKYRPFAVSCSSIYFTLENLGNTHFLYQYSLPFFLSIVDTILFQPSQALKDTSNTEKRLEIITDELFQMTFTRVQRGLQHEDKVGFALRLVQVAREGGMHGCRPFNFSELEFFLKGRSQTKGKISSAVVKGLGLTTAQTSSLEYLTGLNAFSKLSSHMEANTSKWKEFMVTLQSTKSGDDGKEVDFCPPGWEDSSDSNVKLFHHMLVCKVIRSDRVVEAGNALVRKMFGPSFMSSQDSFDLADLVQNESTCKTPLLLVSRPGYDASGKVDALATALNKGSKYESFAMGSPEGYDLADSAISVAADKGSWVLLKNVHLSPTWLSNLEKRLHRMVPHPDFRVFMTMELNDKVPANLLRMSNVVIFEPAVGMKSSMLRLFNQIDPARVNAAPVERGRLYFLLCWIHSVILERLRYVPVGWTKGFEFNQTDVLCAMDGIDEWVSKAANGKANIAPGAIPWDALQALCEQIIYGGRIDNEFDQARLEAFVRSLFVENAYESDHALCKAWDTKTGKLSTLIAMPDAKNYAGFKAWIDNMDEITGPEIIGLPSNSESMLLSHAGEQMVLQLLQLQDHTSEEESKGEGDEKQKKAKRLSFSLGGDTAADRPQWMVQLQSSSEHWLTQIPKVSSMKDLATGGRAEQLVLHPLYRCMQREYNSFQLILSHVASDLQLVSEVLTGKEAANNRVRALFQSLRKDHLPKAWNRYGGSLKKFPTSMWINDFVKRTQTITELSQIPATEYTSKNIWLGGFQAPEAFVAATRQAVAQKNNVSLEDLHLTISVGDEKGNREDSFTFEKLTLTGASWDSKNSTLAINDEDMVCKLPAVKFYWGKQNTSTTLVKVPVYLDHTREQYLFTVEMARPAHIPDTVWNQRGVCITVWSAD